jgi:Holliday junction resolvase-like predicted endonuclease
MQDLPSYEDLEEPDNAADLLAATAVLKLNGGLGTSMGLEKAKSLLVVKEGKTFLDLIAEQVRYAASRSPECSAPTGMHCHAHEARSLQQQVQCAGELDIITTATRTLSLVQMLTRLRQGSSAPCQRAACLLQVEKMREEFKSKVRFIVMNSFSTSKDTTEHLQKEHGDLLREEWELVQNKSPKVDAKTMEPVSYPSNPSMEWCAPAPERGAAQAAKPLTLQCVDVGTDWQDWQARSACASVGGQLLSCTTPLRSSARIRLAIKSSFSVCGRRELLPKDARARAGVPLATATSTPPSSALACLRSCARRASSMSLCQTRTTSARRSI